MPVMYETSSTYLDARNLNSLKTKLMKCQINILTFVWRETTKNMYRKTRLKIFHTEKQCRGEGGGERRRDPK
jgi:hypothetical protein